MLAVDNVRNIILQHVLSVRIILFCRMVNAVAQHPNFLTLQPTDVSPATLHVPLVQVQPQINAHLALLVSL